MNDKWMNDLKDLADSYEKTPPQGLLDDIRREMTSRNIMPASQPLQARRVPMWRQPRIAAAAVALLLVGAATIGYIVSGRQPAPMATSVNTHQAAPMPPVTMPAPAALPTAMAAEGSPTQHLHVHPAATPSATTPLMTVVRHLGQMTGLLPDSLQETTPQPLLATATPTHQPANSPTHHHTTTPPHHHTNPPTHYPTNPPTHQPTPPTWDLDAYYGGLASTLTANGTMMPEMGNGLYRESMSDPVFLNNESPAVAYLPPVRHEKHHQPVRVGISLRYHLSPHWSLVAGLTYSRLTSEMTEESSSYSLSTTQSLHYIGLPLSVSYNIWQNRHVSLYVKAGGEVEKLVKGRATTQSTDAPSDQPVTSDIRESRPVFSTHAAAGIEILTGEVVSIFAEPGVAYHFDNGSGVRSAYTDRPMNFNFCVGLRVNVNR